MEGGTTERHWWTLVAVCGATFMLLVDITIVQVALPTLQRSLHASFSDLQWVISAYALSLSAVILTQGSLADRFGRKRIFIIGVTVFTLASLACGLAHSPAELIGARAVQGIGGAGMFATSLALIGQDFQGAARSSAIAVWGATVGGAVAIGPLVGGALTSAFGWQWIFYVNLPIGVLTLLVSTRMKNVVDPGAKRLDWGGLITFSGGLFLLVLGLTKGNDDGWSSTRIVGTLTAALVLLIAFVFVELHQERPMFDLSLFRKPAFTGVSIATFGIGAGMFALLPYLTLYLQNDLGLSPLQGGERLLPLTTLSFIVPLASRPLTERVPAGLTLFVGLATSAVGIWLFTGLTVASGWKDLLPGLLVGGVGIGLANPAIAKIALGVVAPAARRYGLGDLQHLPHRWRGHRRGRPRSRVPAQTPVDVALSRRCPGGPGPGPRRRRRWDPGGVQGLAREPHDRHGRPPSLRQRDERGHPGRGRRRRRRCRLRRDRAPQGLLFAPARRRPASGAGARA